MSHSSTELVTGTVYKQAIDIGSYLILFFHQKHICIFLYSPIFLDNVCQQISFVISIASTLGRVICYYERLFKKLSILGSRPILSLRYFIDPKLDQNLQPSFNCGKQTPNISALIKAAINLLVYYIAKNENQQKSTFSDMSSKSNSHKVPSPQGVYTSFHKQVIPITT